MSRLPLIQPEDADGELADFYGAVTDLLGRVPNFYRTVSQAPFLAMLFLAFNAANQREWPGARLSGRIKELVVIKTSHLNGCEYCFAHNTSLGAAAGITSDQVAVLSSDDYRQSALFDKREKLALAWAEHVTRNTASERDDIFAQLKAHFSDAEIVELTLIAAMFNMINRINDSLAVPLEIQADVDLIQRSLVLDPAKVGTYLRWLADNWPDTFDGLNAQAEAAATASTDTAASAS